MFKKKEANDVTPNIKKQVRIQKSIYGKHGAVICAIDENTKQLKELAGELREMRKYLINKDK